MRGAVPPAPRWAWITMAAGVVAIAVLGYLAANRPVPPGSTPPASAAETTVSSSSRPSPPPPEPVRVLVVGDTFTDPGSEEGSSGAAPWPELLAGDLDEADSSVTVDVAASAGSGYLQPGVDGRTFAQLLDAATAPFDVAVFFGSRSDTAAAADVQAAAQTTFEAAVAASPGARLVVIGPAWVSADPPGYIVTNRDAVAAAAAAAGATFVDPLALGWFAGEGATLLGPEGSQPTDAGHRYLADRMGPLVQAALEGTR